METGLCTLIETSWFAEALFDHIPDVVFFIKDREGRYLVVNQTLVTRCGRQHKSELIGKTAADFPHLTWGNFFIVNLLPVTIGNIIGGSVMVGLVYWFVYIRKGMVAPLSRVRR